MTLVCGYKLAGVGQLDDLGFLIKIAPTQPSAMRSQGRGWNSIAGIPHMIRRSARVASVAIRRMAFATPKAGTQRDVTRDHQQPRIGAARSRFGLVVRNAR